MAQSTTNLGKIHVFPSESLYNQFKDIIADNDLALLKDDGAYIIAANLAQNGYVKFSNGLILQWGVSSGNGAADITFPITFGTLYSITQGFCNSGSVNNWNWAISSYSVSKFHVIGKGGIGLFWIAVGKA